MTEAGWFAVVLAAGRGAGDAMARAYGVTHKCTILVAGKPMLRRVIEALQNSHHVTQIAISAEDPALVRSIMNGSAAGLEFTPSAASAPQSAWLAIERQGRFPVLLTTGDHALLTPEMIDCFCAEALRNGADFSAGLARAEVIMAAYPETRRTFFRFKADRVSGCNIFAVMNSKGMKIIARWHYLESLRKKPWRLVAAFGTGALLRYALGRLTLADAFDAVSKRLGLTVKPIFLPFAEAAIDVDKPSDKDLAEAILLAREAKT
jgi:GTP:adenosylcobinamide-phosphate guanylyltransferase